MLIDQLPELNSLDDADEVPVERGTSTYKAKITAFIGRFVKKTGDTMTGILTNTANFRRQNTDMTIAQRAAGVYGGLYITDQTNLSVGWIEAQAKADGATFLRIAARTRDGSNANVNHFIDMTANPDGTFAINCNAEAWLKALSLHATSNFPPSSWHNKVSGNAGTTRKYGQVVIFSWNLKQTGAVASGATLATFATGTNFAWAYGLVIKGNSVIGVCHSTSNTIICDVAVPWSSGTEYFTVILTTSLL